MRRIIAPKPYPDKPDDMAMEFTVASSPQAVWIPDSLFFRLPATNLPRQNPLSIQQSDGQTPKKGTLAVTEKARKTRFPRCGNPRPEKGGFFAPQTSFKAFR